MSSISIAGKIMCAHLLPMFAVWGSDASHVYYAGELTFDFFQRAQGVYYREVTVVGESPYEKWALLQEAGTERLKMLPPHEPQVLAVLERSLQLSPTYMSPFLVQLSWGDIQESHMHIEGLCILLQETLMPPLIDPKLSIVDRKKLNIRMLSSLASLKSLELYGCNIPLDTFKDIACLSQLTYIGLPYNSTDEYLKYIGGLKELRFVNLSGTCVNGKGLKYLAGTNQLTVLDLRRTRLERGVLDVLETCGLLETLLLSESTVTDDDLKSISKLRRLHYVTLHKTEVTDTGLQYLEELKSL